MTTPFDLDTATKLAEDAREKAVMTLHWLPREHDREMYGMGAKYVPELAAALQQAVAELRAARAEVERRGELFRQARLEIESLRTECGYWNAPQRRTDTERLLEGKP